MNNRNYWKKRIKLYNATLKTAEKQLGAEYRRCANRVKIDLLDMYAEIVASVKDGTILASDLYKYNRYYTLLNSINVHLTELGLKEVAITEKHLKNLYSNIVNMYIPEPIFTTMFTDDRALQAINTIWCADCKDWSSRIWNNKTLLKNRVEKGITDCIVRGADRLELTEQLMKDFNRAYYEADRVARTELSFVQNKAALDSYLELGVDRYEFLANQADDCCKELNGKIFLIKDIKVGENFPPIHPNCECSILAVVEDNTKLLSDTKFIQV